MQPVPVVAAAPPELVTAPFVGRVAVDDMLLTPKQLRSGPWVRLLRGVYVHRDVELTESTRLEALRLVLPPDAVACGSLAAWLHGVWQPRPGQLVPLDTTRPVPSCGAVPLGTRRRRLTLRGTDDDRMAPTGMSQLDGDVVNVDGVRVTSALRTCFDLMRRRHLVESVVVADAFAWSQALDLTTLAVYAADRRRWPHVRAARTAISLASAGVRSPGESRLRMVVVLAGLPEPRVNVPMLQGSTAQVLGIPDLLVIGRRTVGLEYDGAYHEDDEQRIRDRQRERRLLVAAGLPLLRYDREALWSQRELVVEEVSAAVGVRSSNTLDDRDFWRPRADEAW